MRDVIAGLAAVALVFVAASLATTLHAYRRRRRDARNAELALGRTLIAELPTSDNLVIMGEDEGCFYYGARAIEKDAIVAVRVLINGAPIASCLSSRLAGGAPLPPAGFEDRPEGIARDRWDVAVETRDGTTLIECGAVRERVSQELARAIYEAVKQDIERRDRGLTIPSHPGRRDG